MPLVSDPVPRGDVCMLQVCLGTRTSRGYSQLLWHNSTKNSNEDKICSCFLTKSLRQFLSGAQIFCDRSLETGYSILD